MSKRTALKVIAGAADRPLVIAGIELPCYVLEDETRVLSQRGVFVSVSATRGGPRVPAEVGAQMPRFANQNWLKPYIPNELELVLKSPVRFQPPTGPIAYGYPAQTFVELCNAILAAFHAGATTDRQAPIVDRAMTLIRGFATVGIIALVDEATGYQEIRTKKALSTILEKFIAEELRPWTKTFPYEFYEHIFRLKGWPGPDGVKRPSVIGRYTNDIVYERLAYGVLDELKRKNPTIAPGRRKNTHHQWLTGDVGHPKLKEHIIGVLALMRAAPDRNWIAFMRMLERSYPRKDELPLPVPEGRE